MASQIYNLKIEEVLRKFDTSLGGLTDRAAGERLIKNGRNKIEKKRHWRLLKLVLHQFNDALVWILLAAAALSLVFQEFRDVSIILTIVLLNAFIGFIQEFKAEKILDRIQGLTSDKAFVIRSGKKKEISAEEIVCGDVIFVSSGDNVPADGYLVESYNLRTNSFVFTGESKPEAKIARQMDEQNVSLADIDNMVFMGEQITTGEAKFVVTATGMGTELGKIAFLAAEIKDEPTPLQKKMRILGRDVSILAVSIGILVILAGSFYRLSWYQNFLFALAIAVSVVPEGLPAAMSVALSLGMRRLLRVNVLVKKLIAVETLGSVNVICTDKTGTITKNELTVTDIVLGEKVLAVSGEGYQSNGLFFENGKAVAPETVKNLGLLFKTAVLCNDAEVTEENGNYKIIGDPTEGALIVASRKYNSDEKYFIKNEKKIGENPFESERMRMSVIYSGNAGDSMVNGKFSYVKGSPDAILGLCSQKLDEKGISRLTLADKEKFKALYDEMSGRALRVLAFAYRDLNAVPENKFREESEANLVWQGMMAMIDPPRKDVAGAIGECLDAGLKVIMITGDYELTARAIARNVGLIKRQGSKKNDSFVVNGKQLESMSDRELVKKIRNGACVFARIAPEQKLRIASVLKRSGAIIAMTGDGVNDAPALKKADIGVAMGGIGTDVSKEASDMILLDDNFSSIVSGIKEGRTIYGNIKKFIFYVFSSNSSEFLTVALGMLLQIPAPITAVQILAIDLGTDVFPSLALGVEPAETKSIKQNVQEKKRHLLGAAGFWRLIYVGALMTSGALVAFVWSMKRGGWDFGEKIDFSSALYIKSTAATYAVLSMSQMANLLGCRSFDRSVFEIGFFKNKYLIFSILASVGMLLSFLYIPFFQKYLHMAPIDLWDWAVVAATILVVFLFEEARKAGKRQFAL